MEHSGPLEIYYTSMRTCVCYTCMRRDQVLLCAYYTCIKLEGLESPSAVYTAGTKDNSSCTAVMSRSAQLGSSASLCAARPTAGDSSKVKF